MRNSRYLVRMRAAGLCRPSAERRRWRASSGQALLIAVLILFAVATLAALFAGIIGAQLTQVARQSDLVALRNIAEAGLRLANEQLTYSPAGADWRPSADAYRCGEGQVAIDVTYGPSPDRLQSRFLRIVSTAAFPDNPFLRHTILALKPVLLTDYARFITDRFETNRAANLGVTGLETNGASRLDYVSYIEGPIRSNTDVVWYGQSQVSLYSTFDAITDWRDLGILRDDRIEIAGFMYPAANPGATDALNLTIDGVSRATKLFAPATEEEWFDYANGFPQYWEGEIVPNSRTVLANLPDVTMMTGEVIAGSHAVPRVRPPEIDAIHPDKDTNRYLSLTRDSGFWRQDSEGLYYNTGEFGWGWTYYGGIYIDNFDDIQYDHNLEKLRLNWTRSVGVHQNPALKAKGDLREDLSSTLQPPAGPADWWDKTDRYYAPPGVEIILHGEEACPWVEIVRDDRKNAGGGLFYSWREPEGQPIQEDVNPTVPGDVSYTYVSPVGGCTPSASGYDFGILDGNRAFFPFPPNGVIYAEGNVRIRGIMPPVRDSQGRRGLEIPADEVPEGYFGFWDLMTGRSRRFDLQVVSGGTIYIEGDLMSPSTAQLTGLQPIDPAIPLTMTYDQLYGSRIALLARDYVCVNTTALNPRPVDLFQRVEDPASLGTYSFYVDAQPIYPPGAGPRYWQFTGLPLPQATSSRATEPPSVGLVYESVRLGNELLRDTAGDVRLILGHSGWYEPYAEGGTEPPEAPAKVSVEVAVDGSSLLGSYEFVRSASGNSQSPQWYHTDIGDPAQDNHLEFLPSGVQVMSLAGLSPSNITFTPEVTPVWDGTSTPPRWIVSPDDLAYLLGPLAIAPPNRDFDTDVTPGPLPVDIDALIYAQNGSWFVIPGRWFNEDPDELGEDFTERLYPGYHEPLNIRISVYGAIAENMPADLGSVADWTSKWCGPAGEGASGFLAYRYDPLLRWPRRETEERIGYLRFPNFPMTSDLVIWGERVSGPAGT